MNEITDPKISLSCAISHFGNKAGLARALNLNRVTVTDWVNKYNYIYVPPLHAYRLIRNYPDLFSKDAA